MTTKPNWDILHHLPQFPSTQPDQLAGSCLVPAITTAAILLFLLYLLRKKPRKKGVCPRDLHPGTSGGSDPQTEFKSSYGVYQHAAVASDSKICSDIGRDILQTQGGNAIDAAIATALASTVIYPHSTGMGGGFFATIYHKDHGWYAVDARESAPMGIEPGMFARPCDRGKVVKGGLSICVPGMVKGLVDMHTRFGSLPWKTLVEPALKLLRHGYPISDQTYQALVRNVAPTVVNMEGFRFYLDDKGRVKPPGSLVTNPVLTLTFQTIADDPSSFYNGPLSRDILQDILEQGGVFEPEDLTTYQARIVPTLQTHLPGGLTLHSGPPPAGGAMLNGIMSTIAGYELSPLSVATEESRVLTHHRMLEASRFAMATKTGLGDTRCGGGGELVAELTSRSYGDATRKQIDDSTTLDLDAYGAKFDMTHESGTSHSSVLDEHGNAVSITASLNSYFGSLVVGRRTGIAFNNEMDVFAHLYQNHFRDIPPSPANLVAPGKRPMSSMSPAIVWDNARGRVCLVTGAAGGIKIPEGLATTMADVLYLGRSVPESLDGAKVYQELVPPILMAEDEIPQSVKKSLQAKGHHFLRLQGFTVIQMIQVLRDGSVVAGCDYRKGGQPSGF